VVIVDGDSSGLVEIDLPPARYPRFTGGRQDHCITEDVADLRKSTDAPGMAVLQFSNSPSATTMIIRETLSMLTFYRAL
jgi:hypothetical protein